ncbi:hypothetical protein SAMN05720469_12217 [Fibrobacter intestinalis]|uniref:Uncharacterized protein n=1 Tax=Fibrobacter intestinalis TaxID=28122 RepID=A0A1M6W5H4_9BACT|nr:hypothetical protein SAMN05720469_12217 [Fibrobacter intestinalis]
MVFSLRKAVFFHYFLYLFYYLVCKFGVCRERDVLFLHGRVKKDRAASCRSLFIVVIVDTDTFLEDHVHARFANHVPEVNKFARVAGLLRREEPFSAKILVIGVFLELLHDGLVRYVADVLQDDEPCHETDRLVRRTHLFVEQFGKLGLELVPVNLVRENVEGMLVVQLLLKGTEKACLCVGFWRSVHKKCKVFNPILEILAIFSQGGNQFFPIVMRAGRDFKGRLITVNFSCPKGYCLIFFAKFIQISKSACS